MAEIGRITLSEIALIEIDADPTIAGLEANTGSMAFMTDGSAIYHKSGVLDSSWSRLDKSYIGLPNVDNTSDVNKPTSISTQTALNLKYDASNPNSYETTTQLNSRDTNNRARANHTGTQLSTTVSDFAEAAQDAVGVMLVDTASVDLTYTDGTPALSAVVLPAGVNHNSLQNYVTNEHINHTSVSITANNGLTGGGDISASRTISMLYPEEVKNVTSIQSSTSATYANVTEMVSSSLNIGTYVFKVYATCQSTATGTGIGLRFQNGTAVVGLITANWRISQAAEGTNKNFEYSQIALADNVSSASIVIANANFPVIGEGVFTVTTAGTVAIQIRSETGTSVSIRPSSIFFIKRVV